MILEIVQGCTYRYILPCIGKYKPINTQYTLAWDKLQVLLRKINPMFIFILRKYRENFVFLDLNIK